MQNNNSLIHRLANGNLVLQILVGIVAGVALATVSPSAATSMSIFGSLFVGALKAIAPILVFVLVAASIASQKKDSSSNMRPVITLYLVGTFLAALTAVLMSFAFPTSLTLVNAATGTTPPEGIGEVLNTLLFKIC